MKYFFLLVFMLPSIALAGPNLCKQKSNGALFLKNKCAKGETALSATLLSNLGIVTANSIVDYKNCHQLTQSNACTLDSDAGVEHCTFTCPSGEFVLTAGATPLNTANYSLGSYTNTTYSNGAPLSQVFLFRANAASDYVIIGTCCPRPS